MKITNITPLPLPDVKLVTYQRFHDERGYFTETYRKPELDTYTNDHPEAHFLKDLTFVQHNESFSKANTIRGFHFQYSPYQGKLLRCIQGHLIDFAIDIRPNSPNFGKITGADLKTKQEDEQAAWIWLPPGFAHGVAFPEDTTIEYLCTGEWSPGNEFSISPLAQDIDWSLVEQSSPELKEKYQEILNNSPLIAEKDLQGLTLEEWKQNPNANFFSNLN